MGSPRIHFVLPTKNEQATIGALIQQLKAICERQGWQARIFVADDSEDETPSIARALGAEVIPGGKIGLGFAMARGLSVSLRLEADWVVTLDTDGQVDLDELPLFQRVAEEQRADLVVASRFLSGHSILYPYPKLNWLGNRILVGILRLATGYPFTDSHGGIRWMKPAAIAGIKIVGRHTYVQETLIQVHRRGLKIVEVPSLWRRRESGESRVLHSILLYVRRTLPALLHLLKFHWVGAVFSLALWSRCFLGGEEVSPLVPAIASALTLSSLWISLLPLRALRISDEFSR